MLSEETLIQRAGNFTSSENHKLMAGWDKPELDKPGLISLINTFKEFSQKPKVGELKEKGIIAKGIEINEMWTWLKAQEPSQGLVTYAQEKAIEELFDHDESLNFSTVHTRNGEQRESKCMELLSEKTGIDFLHTGDDQIHLSHDGIGCTPDGIAFDEFESILTGAEAKCKSALVHAKNLLINDNKDMLVNAFDHYTQIQTQMLVTDTDHWYFANYNPFAKSEKMIFKYIIIYRDDVFIKALNKRIEQAKLIKAEFLKQFDKIKENIEK